jgi:hypothetical protein
MPEVTLQLLGQGKSEKFTKPEIRLGRDPSCDLVFPNEKFPMVGRQHAVLRFNGSTWSVEDLQSTNGTFVNQVRIQRQQLTPGDTLRFGSDGPEVRVHFVDESYGPMTRPGVGAAITGSATTQPSATRPSEMPPTRPANIPASPAIAATKASPLPYNPPARTVHTPVAEVAQPDITPPVAAPESQEEISEEEDLMNEQKLSLLRNLVILMVGLVLVLGGIVISQMQQLADIRQNVVDMRGEGKEAVRKFQPELDNKMNKLESDMNAMDEKMQKAQDKFMVRLESEMPKVLDKYVDKKMKEIRSQAPAGMIPQ